MEQKLISLVEEDNKDKYFKAWETNYEEICKLIESKITNIYSSKGDSELEFSYLIKLLNYSIDRSSDDRELTIKIQKFIFKLVIQSIYNNEGNSSNHSRISLGANWLLLVNTKNIPLEVYQSVFNLLQRYIQSKTQIPTDLMEFWALLMKKLKDKRSARETEQCKQQFEENFNFLIDLNWERGRLVQLLKVLIDIPLEEEQLQLLIAKINRLIPSIEWDELPPIIHHLLALSKQGCRNLIISSLIQYFNKIHFDLTERSNLNSSQQLSDSDDDEETNRRAVPQLNMSKFAKELGAILTYFSMQSKQDLSFGSDIIKLIKSGKILYISPFTLALLLNLASIHRFQDEIMTYLKSIIIQSFKEDLQIEKFQSLSDYYPITNMEIILLDLLNYCEFGWDEVIQNLINLSILILDNAPKAAFGKVKESGTRDPIYTKQWLLAITVLSNIFKSHEMFRSMILEEIVGRLYSSSQTQDNYIQLLSHIVSQSSILIDQSLSIIVSTVNTISLIPLTKIEKLIESWLPLLNRDEQFLSDLYIALRKGLFGRSSESRLTSIKGLLQILRLDSAKFRDLSGVRINDEGDSSGLSIRRSSKDILGLFKRCLDQPAIIKKEIYEGFQNYFINNIKRLQLPIINFLFNQFLKYWNDGLLPPIKFFSCVNEEGVLLEPIGPLISALFTYFKSCKLEYGENSDDENGDGDGSDHNDLINRIEQKLDQLVTGMMDIELRHLGFDNEPSFDIQEAEGLQNYNVAQMALNVYEVMIEYQYYKLELSTPEKRDYNLICSLFYKLDSLNTSVKRSNTGGKGKRQFNASDNSVLSYKTCSKIFINLITWKAENSINFDNNLLYYLMLIIKNQLDKLSKSIDILKSDLKISSQLFQTLWLKLGFQKYSNVQFDPSDRLARIFLEILAKLWNFLFNGSRNMEELIIQLAKESTDAGEEEDLDFQSCVQILSDCIISKVDSFNQSDSHQLLVILQNLTKYLDPPAQKSENSKIFKKLINWIKSNFVQQKLESAYLKNLVQFSLELSHSTKNNEIIEGYTKSTQLILETLHPDLNIPNNDLISNMSSCLDDRNCIQLTTELLNWVDSELSLLTWTVNCIQQKLKSKTLAFLPSPNSQSLESIELEICQLTTILLNTLIDLECSCIIGKPSELLVQSLTNMYRFLDLYTRYKTTSGVTNNDPFIQLIKLTGTKLTVYWYAYIPWVQRYEIENSSQTPTDIQLIKKKKSQNKSGTPIIVNKLGNTLKTLKEKRNNSNLTQSSEKLEHSLIILRKRQGLDLTVYFKRSTTRDFRIIQDKVKSIQLIQEELENASNQNESEAEEGEDESTGGRSASQVEDEEEGESIENSDDE